jgi:hypothetical protein
MKREKEKTPATPEQQEKFKRWLAKEITSRTYTDEEMRNLYQSSKKKEWEKCWKILLKGHECQCCSKCQELSKPANTWQEKIDKAEKLTELAEKEIQESDQLRIKEVTELLFKNPKEFFKQ